MKTILKANIILTFSIFFLFIASVIVNAQDNGEWEILNDGGYGYYGFLNIDFVNEEVGWIAGFYGIIKTENGGETWGFIYNDDKIKYQKIDFINNDVGWALGKTEDSSGIFKTIDGGKNWHMQKGEHYSDLFVVSEKVVYAILRKILKTTDGGLSWIDISPDLTNKLLRNVWFSDTEVGILTGHFEGDRYGEGVFILRTFDGGYTWDEKTLSDFWRISDIQFINDSTGFFVAKNRDDNYFLCATTDTLNSWSIRLRSSNSINSFDCVDDKKIYAVTRDSLGATFIIYSNDGGFSWENKTILKIPDLNSPYGGNNCLYICDIYIAKNEVGYMAGGIEYNNFVPILWRSIDNGINWSMQILSYPFLDVCFIDHNNGFAVGGGSLGFHSSSLGNLWFSSDGGKNWEHNFEAGTINSCYFINDIFGFALSSGRYRGVPSQFSIYKTNNLGTDWISVYESNHDSYSFTGYDICFINEQIGWVVGGSNWSDSSGAAILGSTDGGDTWDLAWKYSDTDKYWYELNSIHAVGIKAWAVGESGMIVKYTEENQWQAMPSVTDLPLNDVFFSDENHGWIAGGYFDEDNVQLILLKTTKGGETWEEKRDLNYQINNMYFADSLHGWAVGTDTRYSGMILETEDGGNNWSVQVNGLGAPLNAIYFKDSYGWAVGENGLVLRYDGVNWINQNTGKIYPATFSLSQNYPNPFNPSTKIKFTLPKANKVKIELYNTLGQKIESLLNKHMKAGQHEVEFNAQNLSSGIYYYRIEVGDPARGTGEFQDVKKMILLK